MLIYLVKVNIALILLYGFYQMFCAKDTFFGWRRGLLLGIYAIAFLVPLMPTIDWLMTAETSQGMALTYRQVVLPELTVGAENAKQTWMNAVQWIYIGGVAVLLLRMLVQVGIIVTMIIRTKMREIDGCKVHVIKGKGSPFSFFQWIFVNPDAQTPVQLHEILVHEQTHARQWHSIDVICSELFTIVCWMNPFAWLLRREVRMNIEYLADHRVVANGINSKTYQYHLLGLSYQKNVATISNNFNVLPLKKRIKMMNKRRTKPVGKVKYLFFLPLVAALLAASNIESIARSISEQPTIVKKDAVKVLRQTQPQKPKKKRTPVKTQKKGGTVKDNDDKVYAISSVMPQYEGGIPALMNFLATNMKYPEEAQNKKIEGRVIVNFVVEKDGSLSDFKVVRSIDPLLDAEALRVAKLQKKWKPGYENGKPVRVQYNLPITFKLK